MVHTFVSRTAAPLVALTMTAQLIGCAGTSQVVGDNAAPSAENAAPIFLWSVRKEGKPGRAHLYGSVHLKPSTDQSVDRAVTRTFDGATDLVFEADPSPQNAAALQQTVQALSTYPEGETLRDHIPPELYEQLKEVALPLMGLPEAALERLKPWLLSIMMEVYVAAKLGFKQESGTEQWALRRAGGEKSIHELEGAEAQLQLFASLPKEAQIDQLREILDTIEDAPGKLQKLIDFYEAGDESGLTQHLFQTRAENPSSELLFERFFFERNQKMAAKIDELMGQDKDYFIVVGTGHLVGERSIQDYLAQEHGYAIEKVAPGGRPTGEEADAQREASKNLRTSAEAAELRAAIQGRLDGQAYGDAATMATMGANQMRNGAEVIEGFLDEDYVSILQMGCEPAEWIGNWPQAGRCWTRVLDAYGRIPNATDKDRAFPILGIALAAAQLGQSEQSDEVLARAIPYFQGDPKLTRAERARLFSTMAQLSQGSDPKEAYELARRAREQLLGPPPHEDLVFPVNHPAWRPILMARTSTAYWLGKGGEVSAEMDMLIENLTTGLPQSPVLRDVFTLQRAGYRAESGDKKGAREDVERAMKGLRETLPDTSATFIQYFQGAAKTYIRLGDKKPAAAALKEIEALISKAGAQLGAMAPVLIADLKLLEGRYLLLKRKKKKAIAAMRASLDYAKEHLKDRPVAIGMLQCQLAQNLEKLKKGKNEVPELRSEGIENLKTAFNEDHPAHESCQKGTLPW